MRLRPRARPPRSGRRSRSEVQSMALFAKPTRIPSPQEALPGRAERMPVAEKHRVLGTRLEPPWPEGSEA